MNLEPFEALVVAALVLAGEGASLALIGESLIGENTVGESLIGENTVGESLIGVNSVGESLIGASPKVGTALRVLGGGLLALVGFAVALPLILAAGVALMDRVRARRH